jgi:ribosomal protein L11 methyltransferase
MKTERLWQVSVETVPEAEEAVAALLERLFGGRATIYAPDGLEISTVSIFSPRQKSSPKREALEAGLNFIADCGLRIGPGKISISTVPREDWAESWKKFFKTIEVGSKLLIKPSWSKRKPKKNQAVVVLDPGLSFGTGQHPTTAFCLKQIVRCRAQEKRQTFLDMGTGSGILAIAAAKIGFKTVDAFDFDAQAVRIAKNNARRNRVKVSIKRQDLTKLSLNPERRYDLICANLVADLLIAERKRILARLKPEGALVLAGVLIRQFPEVQRAYEEAGLILRESQAEWEWLSGIFTWKMPGGSVS